MPEHGRQIVVGVVVAVVVGTIVLASVVYLPLGPSNSSSATFTNSSLGSTTTTECVGQNASMQFFQVPCPQSSSSSTTSLSTGCFTTSTVTHYNSTYVTWVTTYVPVCPLNARVTHIVTGTPWAPAPAAAVVDPENSLLYVVNYGRNGTVSVVDPRNDSLLGSYSVGYTPGSITYDPADQDMYITNFNANNVTVFSPKTDSIVQVIPVSDLPNAVVYNSLDGQLDVLEQGQSVGYTILSNDQIVGQLSTNVTGLGASDAILDTTNNELYIADTFQSTVNVLNANNDSLLKSIQVGSSPSTAGPVQMAFDPSNGYIYVTDQELDSVTVINTATNSIVATIPVGATPEGICYDSANGYVFEVNQGSGTVDAISVATNTLVGQVTLQGNAEPHGVYCDSTDNIVYVSDWSIGEVSVISFH